jgi:hypothetical protein
VVQDRLEQLEAIARAAFDAVISVDEWLGSAGTRAAAADALRRLEIKLRAAGFEAPVGKNLDFRGAILDDLERIGLRYDCRDDSLHFFVLGEARCYASGPRLADFLATLGDSLQTDLSWQQPKSQVKRSGRERGGKP